MADKISAEQYAEVNLGFIDEDTRKIKIPNALDEIDTDDVVALNNALKPTIDGSQVDFLVGDRTGAAFTGILTVDRIDTEKVEYDIAN